MTRNRDRFGAPTTCRDATAVDAFGRAATAMLGFAGDPLGEIDAVLARAPDFAMAHCFRAGLFLVSSEAAAEAELARALDSLRRLAGTANERERGHIAAIDAWHRRDFRAAAEHYGRVLFDCPRDIVALQIVHQCDFMLGQTTMLRDRLARVLPAWSQADPEYGFLLGMYAFGLEENGHYPEAEAAGRRAVALNDRDAWAYHAVAHVHEMRGETEAGIGWLSTSADKWGVNNMLGYHNFWHLALFHLERGDDAAALRLLDESIRPAPSEAAMEMLDAAALLWRLRLRGVDVGERWNSLADSYEARAEEAYYPFNDMHAAMAFVATGREAAAGRLQAALERAAAGGTVSARLIREVGLPAVRAILDFGRGNYPAVVDNLIELRKWAAAFGGSHAQRDVLNLTLLEAAIRAGDRAAARGLLNERLAAKGTGAFAERLRGRIEALPERRAAA